MLLWPFSSSHFYFCFLYHFISLTGTPYFIVGNFLQYTAQYDCISFFNNFSLSYFRLSTRTKKYKILYIEFFLLKPILSIPMQDNFTGKLPIHYILPIFSRTKKTPYLQAFTQWPLSLFSLSHCLQTFLISWYICWERCVSTHVRKGLECQNERNREARGMAFLNTLSIDIGDNICVW